MICPPTLTRIFIHHTATHSTASSGIKSQVGLNVLHLVEDLDRVMAKYKATFPIGAKSKAFKLRKKKEQKKKKGEEELVGWNPSPEFLIVAVF